MQNEEQSLSLDAKILAEFERLVLEGHRREIAERLVCNLLGRTALGNRGLTRAAIHGLVMESKVKKPKKTETVTEVEAETKAGTVTELATEAFNAEAIWEPKETHEGRYNLLVEALKNARNAGTPLNIDVASEILKAILAEGSHRNLPAAKAEATTDVPFEASAEAETVPVPALIKLEAEVTRAFERVRESSWDWAVALCAIHDSRLYPDSASAGSWERYTKLRWKLERDIVSPRVGRTGDPDHGNLSIPGDTRGAGGEADGRLGFIRPDFRSANGVYLSRRRAVPGPVSIPGDTRCRAGSTCSQEREGEPSRQVETSIPEDQGQT